MAFSILLLTGARLGAEAVSGTIRVRPVPILELLPLAAVDVDAGS